MTQATRTPSRAQTTAACPPHWWIIAPADGPVSDAYCKTCPATRTFANALPWSGAENYLHAWREYPKAETPQAAEVRRMQAARDVQNAFEGVA